MKFLKWILLLFSLSSCSPSNQPLDRFVLQEVLKDREFQSPNIVYTWNVNLDEDTNLEAMYLVRNGVEEILASFKKEESNSSSQWKLDWRKSFSLLNIGPLEYSEPSKQWIPSKTESNPRETYSGFILKNIRFLELPGDRFSSVFAEVVSEDPILGIISVPLGLRKGVKILDGFSLLAEHPGLKEWKRVPFDYKPEDKSILLFPQRANYQFEMVFNGFEMIPNLASYPIPSLLKIEKKEEHSYLMELKNRGGVAKTTYLTFSFPECKDLELLESKEGIRIFKPGDRIFSRFEKKKIPAQVPMIEITKQNWGTNYRFSFGFKTKGDPKPSYLLFRSSYLIRNETEILPNSSSVLSTELDQQGYPAYKVPLP